MFVAIRDIRFAKGRFTLMGSVVLLLTLLIVLLSGLTAGLAAGSTSGITNLPATHIAFGSPSQEPAKKSFADSAVTEQQLRTWSAAEGVEWAAALGITQTRLVLDDGSATSVALFGVRPSGPLAPEQLGENSLVISQGLAKHEGLDVGDSVRIAGHKLTIAGLGKDSSYNHTPVAWVSLDTWNDLARAANGSGPPLATVITAKVTDTANLSAIDARAGTLTTTVSGSLGAIGSFSSENGSLLMMQAFLYVISALVTSAFLTVWTIQRTGDIAVLKALGGSTRYLMRDALAQSLIVLLIGAGAGGAVGVALGMLVNDVVPFVLTAGTTVLPILAMILLGMAGAALAVRRITKVDPLTALGAAR